MSCPGVDDQMEQAAAVFKVYDHELRPRSEPGSVGFSQGRKSESVLRVVDCEVRPTEDVKSDDGVNANSDSAADPGKIRHCDLEVVALHGPELQIRKRDTLRGHAFVEGR